MNLTVEFHRPEQLPNPKDKYEKLLSNLHRDIGSEQLQMRIAGISAKWAMESGYYFFYGDNDLHFKFIHVSLNPKDFGI